MVEEARCPPIFFNLGRFGRGTNKRGFPAQGLQVLDLCNLRFHLGRWCCFASAKGQRCFDGKATWPYLACCGTNKWLDMAGQYWTPNMDKHGQICFVTCDFFDRIPSAMIYGFDCACGLLFPRISIRLLSCSSFKWPC